MLLPPAADRPQEGGRARGPDPEALPRGVVRPRAAALDRALEPARRARGAPVRRRGRRAARRRPRPLVHRRRRHGQDDARDADLQGGDGGRPDGRDLLAAAAARPAARHVRRQRAVLAQRADRPAGRRRPPARRRRRRGADHAVGARAALRDRQHPLRGRQGDPADDEPHRARRERRRAARADRRPHRVPALRGLRRSEGDVRARPAARVPLRAEPCRPTGDLGWDGDEPAYGEPRPPRRRLAS